MQPSIKLSKTDLSYLDTYKSKSKLSLREYNRLNTLLLLNKSKKVVEIEEFLNVDRITIWRIKKRYLEHGIEKALYCCYELYAIIKEHI
jgi:predicted transcriptional regulator